MKANDGNGEPLQFTFALNQRQFVRIRRIQITNPTISEGK